jgi:hypothetical protein
LLQVLSDKLGGAGAQQHVALSPILGIRGLHGNGGMIALKVEGRGAQGTDLARAKSGLDCKAVDQSTLVPGTAESRRPGLSRVQQ